MAGVLFIIALLEGLVGYAIYDSAFTIFQQQLAASLFVGTNVLVAGAFVVMAVERIPKSQREYEAKMFRAAEKQRQAAMASGLQPPQAGQPAQ